MAEITSKPRRQEQSDDVLMFVGARTDKATGEMKAQLRGVGANSIFQTIRNAILSRRPASADDVKNLFIKGGMSPEAAEASLQNVKLPNNKGYSAAAVNQELNSFASIRQLVEERQAKSGISST